ncbi:MAG TPA: nitrous oxide-stimulated promoter family protein [Dehalococcoidales bacterium]|jgi:Nitrous oxide-stimulated promoter.|nr:nitrous oxide-stimulated promoter family protein [Dehalococcoidales bacterium]
MNTPRLAREIKTVDTMILLYCKKVHKTVDGLCSECEALQSYAHARLTKCPHEEIKPKCAKCQIHCYALAQRARIQAVMRYSGPRMLLHRPDLAVQYLLD